MKKIVSSLVVSVALMSTLNASDFYATVNGEEITKKDILRYMLKSIKTDNWLTRTSK